MLSLDIVLYYFDALYKADRADCPGYDEFRDMFSGGQINSKSWIIDELQKISEIKSGRKKVVICGAWYGVLAFMLEASFENFEISSLDFDERCFNFISAIKTYDKIGHRVNPIKENMFHHVFTEDLVINTSCEHIENISDWLSNIPKGVVTVLQSSDLKGLSQHINCVSSADELILKAGAENKEMLYKGELVLSKSKRFMIIFKN